LRPAIDMFWDGVRSGTPPAWLADEETTKRLAVTDVDTKAQPVDLSENEAVCRDLSRYRRWKRHADFVDAQLSGMKARVRAADDGAREARRRWSLGHVAADRAPMIPAKYQEPLTYRGGFTVSASYESGLSSI
jgi:hypothetical protein